MSALVKLTEGKRVSMDKYDDWIDLQYFVAVLRSNAVFSSTWLNEVGTCANGMRNKRKKVLSKRKNQLHNYYKLESAMERRNFTGNTEIT